MSRFNIISDPVVSQWIIDRLGEEDTRSPQDFGPHISFGILKDGVPVCGVAFNWYRQLKHGGDMRVIIAADDPSWCLPGILRELFRYPFEIAGCSRLTAIIRDGNERSLKLCLGLGFRREGVLRRGYDGKTNAIILGMLKSECKWLHRSRANGQGMKDGREGFRTKAAGSGSNGKRTRAGQQRGDLRISAG